MAGTHTKHIPTLFVLGAASLFYKNNPGPAENLSQETMQCYHCVSAISKRPQAFWLAESLTLDVPLQLQSNQVLQFLTSRTVKNSGNHSAKLTW